MERKVGQYSWERILPLIGTTDYRTRIDLDGDPVKVSTLRLKTFKVQNAVCQHCGIKGSYFVKERRNPSEPYHLNLYALTDGGKEVLMTHDHIVPLAKGGAEFDSRNVQVLCFPCNGLKGTRRDHKKSGYKT